MRLPQILWLCAGLLVSCASLAESQTATAAPTKTTFSVLEYRIEGNKVLSEARIEEAVSPFLGADKSIADVEAARSALEKAYQEAGYLTVLVDIPEQTVASGTVRLKVAEGSVEKVRVIGSRYYDLGRILAKVPELAQNNVPYFPGVQKQMADANRASDLRVTPVLRPGKTPGTVDVDLKVDDKLPLHSSLELNNYAGPNTRPLRLAGMVRYDNLWQKEHSLSLQYQTTPQQLSQVRVLSGTYLMPLSGGNQLAMYAVASRSNVAAVGNLTMLGQGNIFGARWVMPLWSKAQLTHSVTLGVDYKNFKDDTLLAGANTGHTPISYIPFSVGYSAGIPGDGSMTNVNTTLNFKLRGVGDKTTLCNGQTVSQFECKRFGATSDYFYMRGGLDHTETLSSNLSLFAKVDGQMTSGPLISNEQLIAGGADSVRGYMEAEQAGDDGARGTLELRGPQWGECSITDLHGLAFVDAAHLRVRSPLPAQQASSNLSSFGVGLRAQSSDNWNLRLDVGFPRKTTLYTQANKAHVAFRMSASF